MAMCNRKVYNMIGNPPEVVVDAAVRLLSPYFPGFTTDELQKALNSLWQKKEEEERPKAYTRKQAAKIIGVHSRTIDRYMQSGILKAYKIGAGKLVRLTAESVLKAAGQL